MLKPDNFRSLKNLQKKKNNVKNKENKKQIKLRPKKQDLNQLQNQKDKENQGINQNIENQNIINQKKVQNCKNQDENLHELQDELPPQNIQFEELQQQSPIRILTSSFPQSNQNKGPHGNLQQENQMVQAFEEQMQNVEVAQKKKEVKHDRKKKDLFPVVNHDAKNQLNNKKEKENNPLKFEQVKKMTRDCPGGPHCKKPSIAKIKLSPKRQTAVSIPNPQLPQSPPNDKHSQNNKKFKTQYILNGYIDEIVHHIVPKKVCMHTYMGEETFGLNYFLPQYRISLAQGSCLNSTQILVARKKAFKLNSTYKIYTKNDQQSDDIYAGKVKSSFNGHYFNIFQSLVEGRNHLVGSVHYVQNKNISEPILFQVFYLTKIRNQTLEHFGDQDLVKSLRALKQDEKCSFRNDIKLARTRIPVWDAARQEYKMDFKGRANRPSQKNFILEDSETKQEILMMGKFAHGIYNFDISYPLSPVLAMGIMLTKFQNRSFS